jgi:hypothetical protein
LIAVLAACAGCGHHLLGHGHGPLAATQTPGLPNPLPVPATDYEFLWQQLVDEVDDYFRIEREERVRLVGGVLTEGRIETFPQPGATVLEPWRGDSTHGFERTESTLQSIRRRATVRVIPAAEGYLVELAVFKELEDVNRPENATSGGVSLRHDGSLVRVQLAPEAGPTTLGWIPLGRDVSLEQKMLGELQRRLSGR